MQHLTQPLFLLGHATEDPQQGIHGNEAYLYIVAIPAYNLKQSEPPVWRVAVSRQHGFPRWDAQTNVASSEAAWQSEGTLAEVIKQINCSRY